MLHAIARLVASASCAVCALSAPAAAQLCNSVRAALFADLNLLPDCEATLSTGSCAGLTPNECMDQRYASPSTSVAGSGDLELAYLPQCEHGTATCPPAEQVRCIDGTRPAVYWKAATTGPSSRWLFYLGGEGGPCSAANEPGECFDRLLAGGAHGDSLTTADATQRATRGGVFGWEDFHRVTFEKCHVGEASAGVLQGSAEGSSGNVYDYFEYHQGRRIWNTLFAFLALNPPSGLDSLGLATQVLLVGHSDGAKGLIYTADSLSESLRQHAGFDLDVRVALDGHFLPFVDVEHAMGNGNVACRDRNANGTADVYDHCDLPGLLPPDGLASGDGFSDATYRPGGRTHDSNESHQAELDASCLNVVFEDGFELGDVSSWSGAGHGASRCHSEMHVLLDHLETPAFVRMDLLDVAWLGAAPQHADDPQYRFAPAEFADRVRRIAQNWITLGASRSWENPPPGAMYMPLGGGPGSHTSLTQTAEFQASRLKECQGGVAVRTWSTEELLVDWLAEDPFAPVGDYQALWGRLPMMGTTWVSPAEACP